MTEPARAMFADRFRALRHRNFRLFWSGQIVSVIGTWMQSVAQGWLMHRLTNSAWMLGVLGFTQFIPVTLLSLWAGVIAVGFALNDFCQASIVGLYWGVVSPVAGMLSGWLGMHAERSAGVHSGRKDRGPLRRRRSGAPPRTTSARGWPGCSAPPVSSAGTCRSISREPSPTSRPWTT